MRASRSGLCHALATGVLLALLGEPAAGQGCKTVADCTQPIVAPAIGWECLSLGGCQPVYPYCPLNTAVTIYPSQVHTTFSYGNNIPCQGCPPDATRVNGATSTQITCVGTSYPVCPADTTLTYVGTIATGSGQLYKTAGGVQCSGCPGESLNPPTTVWNAAALQCQTYKPPSPSPSTAPSSPSTSPAAPPPSSAAAPTTNPAVQSTSAGDSPTTVPPDYIRTSAGSTGSTAPTTAPTITSTAVANASDTGGNSQKAGTNDSPTPVAAIAGGVAGGVAALAAVFAAIVWYRRSQRPFSTRAEPKPQEFRRVAPPSPGLPPGAGGSGSLNSGPASFRAAPPPSGFSGRTAGSTGSGSALLAVPMPAAGEAPPSSGVRLPHWFFVRKAAPLGLLEQTSVAYPEADSLVALTKYNPSSKDEIFISPGQMVQIRWLFRDGWGAGTNLDTGAYGMFPLDCLRLADTVPSVSTSGTLAPRVESRSIAATSQILSERLENRAAQSGRRGAPPSAQRWSGSVAGTPARFESAVMPGSLGAAATVDVKGPGWAAGNV